MSDTPPDRLSSNPKSPYYDEAVLQRGVGVRFKGVEKTNVEEYCVSEGWVRVAVGKTLDRLSGKADDASGAHVVAQFEKRLGQVRPHDTKFAVPLIKKPGIPDRQ